jgi:hypothetical protein
LEGAGLGSFGLDAVRVVARPGLETATASEPAAGEAGAPRPPPSATVSGCGRDVGAAVRSTSAAMLERAKAAAALSAGTGRVEASGLKTLSHR